MGSNFSCVSRTNSLEELREELMARQEFYNQLLLDPPEGTAEMLALISTLQSDRLDDQRAELRPVNTQAALPGVHTVRTTRTMPEAEFLEVLARVQNSRLEQEQRSAAPVQKNAEDKEKKKEKDDSQNDFLNRLMKAQAGRMEDQRATIPLKEKAQPSNSKN